jgi:hypothetical protein
LVVDGDHRVCPFKRGGNAREPVPHQNRLAAHQLASAKSPVRSPVGSPVTGKRGPLGASGGTPPGLLPRLDNSGENAVPPIHMRQRLSNAHIPQRRIRLQPPGPLPSSTPALAFTDGDGCETAGGP